MRKLLIIMIGLMTVLSAVTSVQGQDYEELRLKQWSASEPLSWDDLSVRHLPDSLEEYARLVMTYKETGRYRGNRKWPFKGEVRTACVNRLLSWYDPDHCDEWTLRYLRVLFDMEEYELRSKDFIHLGLLPEETETKNYLGVMALDYFDLIYDSIPSFKFQKDSRYGRDTAVILEYEQRYKALLDSVNLDRLLPQR